MNKLTKLFIAFWPYLPLIIQAEEERTIVISSSQTYGYQSQNEPMDYDHSFRSGIGNPDMDDYFRRYNNRTLVITPHPEPYKSPFTRENFKHMAAVGASLGIGEIVFEFGIKQLFKDSYGTHHLMPLLITSNILFDLFTATGGFYAYKQWFKSPEDAGQD